MHTRTTLHEYRLNYPNTATVPTMTQIGWVGPLLEHERQKRARTLRRRATRQRFFAMPFQALKWIGRVFSTRAYGAPERPGVARRFSTPANSGHYIGT